MVRRAFLLSIVILLWCGFSPAIARVSTRRHHHRKALPTSLRAQDTGHHHRRWRRIFWNPVFRPSHDSLLKQNAEIDRLELPRIQDDAELEQLKLEGKLVPIIPGETLRIDPRLDPDRRYCRPWTRDFVEDLAAAYHQQFGDQIQVNSAVRTVVVQKKLRRHNRNAAPAEGEIASSHLAGVTVDLQRRGMSKTQIKWVESYLVPMKAAGLVEPEEERRQWVFHIMVSDRYSEWHDRSEVAVQRAPDDILGAKSQDAEPRLNEVLPPASQASGLPDVFPASVFPRNDLPTNGLLPSAPLADEPDGR